MTIAYMRGHRGGMRRIKPGSCPYEGHTDASMALQMEWMRGYFDGLTAPVRVRKRGPRVTYRKSVRRGWPKSEYARKRVQELLR